jgi:hypothetical protein
VLAEELSKVTSMLGGVVKDLDGDTLSGSDAALLVERFSAISRLASAGIALCAKRVDETRHFERCGHKSAESWLGDRTGAPTGAARSLISTAGRLCDLPELEGALRAGELSAEQAAHVARGGAADPSAARVLLDRARTGSLRELRDEADKIEAAARSREQDEARHARIRAARHLRTWLDADGSFKGRFSLTPEDGALFLSGIETEANHLFDVARRAGSREAREAYLADALVAIATGEAGAAPPEFGTLRTRSAGAPAPDRVGSGGPQGSGRAAAAAAPATGRVGSCGAREAPAAHPRDEAGLSGRRGVTPDGEAPRAEAEPVGRPGTRPRSRRQDSTILFHVDFEALRRGALGPGEECTVEGGGHVPLSVVQQYLDTARVRLVVESGCDVTSVFSCTRTIPASVQTALAVRDRTCVVPGCASTFHLEIDHIVEFAKGGKTMLSNLCRLCRMHHAMKSQEGYRIEGGPGKWRWIPPPRRRS